MNTLREAVHDYVEMRQSLGYKLQNTERQLPKFISFLEERGASHITVALALQWVQDSSAHPKTWARRLSFVSGFARYRRAFDPRTEVPPQGLLPCARQRQQPYLYNDEEIRRLLDATQEIRGFSSRTYHCLLGLLTVTGLRISEALNLRVEHVDLTDGVLTIRESKFRKSRLVPLHPSAVNVLADYARERRRVLHRQPAPFFFISRRGTRLSASRVRTMFYALSRRVGLREPLASHGPRLHDFRHRFAVHTLLQWYRSGEDVERRLPVLSTYLGHTNVSNTYWYLSACPDLMGLAVKRLDERWRDRA